MRVQVAVVIGSTDVGKGAPGLDGNNSLDFSKRLNALPIWIGGGSVGAVTVGGSPKNKTLWATGALAVGRREPDAEDVSGTKYVGEPCSDIPGKTATACGRNVSSMLATLSGKNSGLKSISENNMVVHPYIFAPLFSTGASVRRMRMPGTHLSQGLSRCTSDGTATWAAMLLRRR